MASTTKMTFHVRGLQKRELAALKAEAKQLGVAPEEYFRDIIRDRLAIAREARRTTFAELAAPMHRDFKRSRMTESELDALVDRARTRHNRRTKG